jgi:hypothetical protein
MARLDKLLKFLSLQSNSIICVSYSAPVTIHNSYLDSHPILVRHSWLHVGFVDNEVSDKDWWTKVTIGGRGENRKSMASLIMPVSGEIWKDQSSEKPMPKRFFVKESVILEHELVFLKFKKFKI